MRSKPKEFMVCLGVALCGLPWLTDDNFMWWWLGSAVVAATISTIFLGDD